MSRPIRAVVRRVARPVMRGVISTYKRKTSSGPVYIPSLDFSDSRNSQYVPLISAFA